MGGEKSFVFLVLFLLEGSPPHGRGKVCVATHFAAYSGITPAWAGKSWAVLTRSVRRRDHPRMGGEKEYYNRVLQQLKGSPPRRRGKDE